MRLFFSALLVLLGTSASAQEYCLALRGNGELAPAHWGAMANLVEKMGMPQSQAGGSSASITMMLNDAIAGNKYIKDSAGEIHRQRAALMYKSLEGFLTSLTNTAEWRDFLVVFQRANSTAGTHWLENLNRLLAQAAKMNDAQLAGYIDQNAELLKSNYRTGVSLGLISEKNYAPLLESLSRLSSGQSLNPAEDAATARFYAGELKETIRVFGAFNADTDDNLFFRPGLVDFARLSDQLGRVATFYSGLAATKTEDFMWKDFLETCAAKTSGMTWTEIESAHRDCSDRFGKIIVTHFGTRNNANFASRKAGSAIKSYPTTSVLILSANEDAREFIGKYGQARSTSFGRGFFLRNPEHVKFGYWGEEVDLSTIDSRLPKERDEKSRRFLSLGTATWRQILSLSPAEPGLASMQPFSSRGVDMVSAGGWSDLHPIMVLKAAGCDRVIYVTRRGGESPFAQGVAKRLFAVKDQPQAADELLTKLYSLSNPLSSMRQSLDLADAVLCTDWNRFDVKNGVKDLIKDSYRGSPYFVRNQSAFPGNQLVPQLNPRDVQPDGKPTYEGCF